MKIRLLAVVLVLLLAFVGWYTLYDNYNSAEAAYTEVLNSAREQVSLGINEKAAENYRSALEKKESFDVRSEMVSFLLDIGAVRTLEAELEELATMYPKEPKTYEYMAKYAVLTGNIEELFSVENQMKGRNVISTEVTVLCKEHRYDFVLLTDGYSKMDPFMSGYARVYNEDGKVGFVNADGSKRIATVYEMAAPYTGINYFIVKNAEDQTVMLDLAGVKTFVDKAKRGMVFDDLQGYNEKKMPVSENGSYRYIDFDYNDVIPGKTFLFAGMYIQGRAAVKDESGWFLIDENQERVGDIYEEIKLTENGNAVRGGLAVVKKDGKWYVADLNGAIKVTEGYEDIACVQDATENPVIAVKKNEKWGFIDSTGQQVIDFVYEDARSFCRGLAAVKLDGLWGLIDTEGTMVVQPQFMGIYESNTSGIIPVDTGRRGWKLLKFYGYEQ